MGTAQPFVKPQSDPWELLRELFRQPFGVSATFVQRRIPTDGGEAVTVHVRVVEDEGLLSKVIEPTLLQGIMMLDDGDEMSTFYPDDELLFIQPSPHLFRPSADWRIRRAKRNYNIEIERQTVVAGRKGTTLLLRAKHAFMPDRKFVIDNEQAFLLRAEREMDRQWIATVDTKVVQFGKKGTSGTVSLETPRATKVKRSTGPLDLRKLSGGKLESMVGFTPRTPQAVPFGFEVTRQDLIMATTSPVVATRLSDGISSVTVYQWSKAKHPKRNPVSFKVLAQSASGILFAASGDVPHSVEESLAETFASHYVSKGTKEGSGDVFLRYQSSGNGRLPATLSNPTTNPIEQP